MEQGTPITLLYTAALEGQLALLPRLFTCLRQERVSASGPVLLVDLGRSCVPGAWLCDSTGGRGMLVAMDAMGYDAFHIGPLDMLYMQPAMVNQLRQIILTPLAAGPWIATVHRAELTFTFANAAQLPSTNTDSSDLLIGLRLSDRRQVEAIWQQSRRVLLLDGGAVETSPLLGRLDAELLPTPPYIRMLDHRFLTLSGEELPDPTIAGVIEFVESEARYAERKRSQA